MLSTEHERRLWQANLEARLRQSRARSATVQTGSITGIGATAVALQELCGISSDRTRLQISVSSGVGYVTDNISSAPGTGYPVTPGYPLILSAQEHGDLVRHSFYGSGGSGPVNFGVVEVHGDAGAVG